MLFRDVAGSANNGRDVIHIFKDVLNVYQKYYTSFESARLSLIEKNTVFGVIIRNRIRGHYAMHLGFLCW